MNKLEFLLFLNDLVQEEYATYESQNTPQGTVHQWNIGNNNTFFVQWHEGALHYQDYEFLAAEGGQSRFFNESNFETLKNYFSDKVGRFRKQWREPDLIL